MDAALRWRGELHGSPTRGRRAHAVESARGYVDSIPIQDCFGDCSGHDAESPQPAVAPNRCNQSRHRRSAPAVAPAHSPTPHVWA